MHVPVTAREKQLHLEELERLRTVLFRRRTPSQCFIVQESVVEPSVTVLWTPDTHRPIRSLLRGGWKFELRLPQSQSTNWIQVQHWDSDRYWLTMSFAPADRPTAHYTTFSFTTALGELERQFLRCIGMVLKERGG